MLATEGEKYITKGSDTLSANTVQYRFKGVLKCIQEFYPNGDKQPLFGKLSLNGYDSLNDGYSPEMWQPQHLYLVDTNAKIEISDICKVKNAEIIGKLFYNETFKEYNLLCVSGDISLSVSCEKTNLEKIIASTDESLDLPNFPENFLNQYVSNPDLIIVSCSIFEYDNSCHIEYCSQEQKEATIKEMQERSDSKLPKTTKEFIKELNIRAANHEWEFTGKNPFTDANKRNSRLQKALSEMALYLFGDDDLVELEDLWNQCVENSVIDYKKLEKTLSFVDLLIKFNIRLVYIVESNYQEIDRFDTFALAKEFAEAYSKTTDKLVVVVSKYLDLNK